MSLASAYHLDIITVWPVTLRGFLASAPESSIEALVGDPRVEFVEQNFTGTTADVSATVTTSFQGEYLWQLDRIDEVSVTDRDNQYNMCTDAQDVYVYVLNDSGIYEGHNEFAGGRVYAQYDFFGDLNNGTPMATGPCRPSINGASAYHGTAVASVVGGNNIGSSRAKLISLRSMTCGGQFRASDAVEAVSWIESHPYYPSVITQSSFFQQWNEGFATYNRAVKLTVEATQIPFFKSADNFSTDACMFSPNVNAYTRVNRSGTVFVVGGTTVDFATWLDPNDYRWQLWESDGTTPKIGLGSGSNGGGCVSGYAPAAEIYVAMHSGSANYQRFSGTSFAAPLVAGLAARYMAKTYADTGEILLATEVYDWLLLNSTRPVQMTQTAATYWACVLNNGGAVTYHKTKPVTCLPTQTGPFVLPYATNTSEAGMISWDEGTCP